MNLLFVANCQASKLGILSNIIAPTIKSDWIEVQNLKDTDRAKVEDKIAAADLVLYYPIADSWKHEFVRSSFIRDTAKQSVGLTNIYFEGLHPDITLVGKVGARLQSPLGDYHSRTAIFAWRAGLSVAEACALVENAQIAERLGYRDAWDRSLAELGRRSSGADVRYADRFEEVLYDRLPLFVVNHPVTFLMEDYARRILDHVGARHLPMPADCFPQWMLSNAVFPVFSYIREWNNLPYEVALFKAPREDRYFTLAEFIEKSFEMYNHYTYAEMTMMNDAAKWRPLFSQILGREL